MKTGTLNIRYDKLRNKRYLRTMTIEGRIIKHPLNLKSLKVESDYELNKDFNELKKLLRGKML